MSVTIRIITKLQLELVKKCWLLFTVLLRLQNVSYKYAIHKITIVWS